MPKLQNIDEIADEIPGKANIDIIISDRTLDNTDGLLRHILDTYGEVGFEYAMSLLGIDKVDVESALDEFPT